MNISNHARQRMKYFERTKNDKMIVSEQKERLEHLFDPCIEHCYNKYGKQYSIDCDDKCEYAKIIKEKKLLEEEMDRPIKTLTELATQFCCLTECKNCPVMIHEYEKRTKYEKENLHIPCCDNLYKWIVQQSKN